MTMKKLSLSVLAAAALSVSAYAGGSLTLYSGSAGKMSKELIDATSVEHNITTPLLYTNGMTNASASEVGFDLRIPGATLKNTSGTNLAIAVMDGEGYKDENLTVATFGRFDGTVNAIIFNSVNGTSIERGKKYKIVTDVDANETHSHSNTIAPGDLEVTINKGSASVDARLIAIDNTGVNTLDDVTANILVAENQFKLSVSQPLSASIDAAQGFKQFTTVDGKALTTTSDDIAIDMENNSSFDIFAVASEFRIDIVADQNISNYKTTVAAGTWGAPGTTGTFDSETVTDSNVTLIETTDAAEPFDTTAHVTLNIDKTNAMTDTVFKATGVVTFNGSYTATPMNVVDAGSWTIYGYNAQVPDVMPTDDYVTYIKLTNRSSIDAGVYFTLIDQDGTVVTVDSDNDGISALAKDTTVKYKAADLAAIATSKDAEFDASKSISIEVSVPTTPNKVYGYTSLKNKALGQFKDLPMYSNKTNSY